RIRKRIARPPSARSPSGRGAAGSELASTKRSLISGRMWSAPELTPRPLSQRPYPSADGIGEKRQDSEPRKRTASGAGASGTRERPGLAHRAPDATPAQQLAQ